MFSYFRPRTRIERPIAPMLQSEEFDGMPSALPTTMAEVPVLQESVAKTAGFSSRAEILITAMPVRLSASIRSAA